MSHKQIRFEGRVRNNVLWHAIFDRYRNVHQFCLMHRLNPAEVGSLLNLKKSPLRKDGSFRFLCERISKIVGMLPEDLFPLELYTIKQTEVTREIAFSELPAHSRPLLSMVAAPDTPFEALAQKEERAAIDEALTTLTGNYREVIRLRLEGQTYSEIAARLKVSRAFVAIAERKGHERIIKEIQRKDTDRRNESSRRRLIKQAQQLVKEATGLCLVPVPAFLATHQLCRSKFRVEIYFNLGDKYEDAGIYEGHLALIPRRPSEFVAAVSSDTDENRPGPSR